MTTTDYYRHCRTLAGGRIGAADCLRMAREAAEADRLARLRRAAYRGPDAVCLERIGAEQPVRLSFSIKCY